MSLKIFRMRSRGDGLRLAPASPPTVGVAVAYKPDYRGRGVPALLPVVRVGVVREVGQGRLAVELGERLV